MRKPYYLDRWMIEGPYVGLCLNEKVFEVECKRLGIADLPFMGRSGANATTHVLDHVEHGIVFLVCIRYVKAYTAAQHYSLLVHEAVHIWQHWSEMIGEREPSWEFEAYSIQGIAQKLMVAFDEERRVKAA